MTEKNLSRKELLDFINVVSFGVIDGKAVSGHTPMQQRRAGIF